MAQKAISSGGVLSAEEVKSRKARSVSQDFCFISLEPLTDETRFTLIGQNEQFNIHKKYAEDTMRFVNK